MEQGLWTGRAWWFKIYASRCGNTCLIMAALHSRCGHSILPLWWLPFFFFPCLISAITDWMSTILHTRCGLSATLECRSEICCTRLTENTQRRNLSSAHHRTTLLGYILRHVSTIGKKIVKQLYLLHMSSQYGERRPTSSWHRLGVCDPQQILTGFASWLRYYSDVARRRSTTLSTMFGHLLGWNTIYTFFGVFSPVMEFCQVQNSLCIQVLHYPILATLLHGTGAVDISQTLQHGIFTRQDGHPIRNWAVDLSS